MKILRISLKALSYVLISILGIVFLSNFYIMLMSYLNPGTHPTVFGYTTAVVVSGSMAPTINVDDVVVIKSQDTYAENDMIAYSTGKSLVTHRIVGLADEGFITKGDANNTEDAEPIPLAAITGKVVRILPGLGKTMTFLKSPLGLMLILFAGLGIAFLPEKTEKN